MKTRIKVIELKNGEIKYMPQVSILDNNLLYIILYILAMLKFNGRFGLTRYVGLKAHYGQKIRAGSFWIHEGDIVTEGDNNMCNRLDTIQDADMFIRKYKERIEIKNRYEQDLRRQEEEALKIKEQASMDRIIKKTSYIYTQK